MKIIFRTAVLAALVIVASCGKDEASPGGQSEEQAELIENTSLDVNLVSDNVIITGSTKESGVPPTANGAISLDLSNNGTTALLNEGFDVSFSSDGDVVGAYLRFVDEDGTVADSYYDINIETNTADDKSGKRIKSKIRNRSHLNAKTDETDLDVDFNSAIEPGRFCYEICVYDAEGNISEPQDVCIKVEAWGGNSEVVGKWTLLRQYSDATPDDIKTVQVEYCDSNELERSCQMGAISVSFTSNTCEKIEYSEITMNSDGTYSERFKDISMSSSSDFVLPEGLTLDQVQILCDRDFGDSESILTFDSEGYWTYNSDDDNILFIEYNFEEVLDGESYSDSFEPGNGSLYYGAGGDNGEVQLINGKLVISSFEFQTAEYEK